MTEYPSPTELPSVQQIAFACITIVVAIIVLAAYFMIIIATGLGVMSHWEDANYLFTVLSLSFFAVELIPVLAVSLALADD